MTTPTKRILLLAMEIECVLEDDDVASFDECTPLELGRLAGDALAFPDTQAEMFAGTGILVRFDAIRVTSANWNKP